MAVIFNADEAFAMAEEIERNGQKFYRRGAEIAKEEGANKLLLDLAEWERSHEKLFTAMRSELSDEEKKPTAFDPQGESEMYLQAMADTHVFSVKQDPAAVLAGAETIDQIISAALDFERDSILFFLGLKDMVPKRLGPEKVDRIIKEEIGHVAYLRKQLAKSGAA